MMKHIPYLQIAKIAALLVAVFCRMPYGLTGQSIALDDEGVKSESGEGVNEGVKTLLDVIRSSPGKRANELATLIGKSVQTVERYVKSLKEAGEIEFRGAPKNGGYHARG